MDNLLVSTWLPSFLVPFFTLSYATTPPAHPDSFHDSLYYATGVLDACVIVSCIALMAVLRDITRIYLAEPFAKWKLTRDWERSQREKIKVNGAPNRGSVIGSSVPNGIVSHNNGEHASLAMSRRDIRRIHRSMLRFGEQSWSFIYFSVNFTFGVYVHCNVPTRVLHPSDLWLNYPHVPLAGTIKFYYLTQMAFYLHQVWILNAEARRKDYVQTMAHHFIAIALMVSTYVCNFTRTGCLVMILMDCSDVFLPLAKMLRYIALYTLCDVTFIVFLVSWFITRHVLFVIFIKSTLVDSIHLVPEMWAPERGNYASPLLHKVWSILVVLLEVLQVIWFRMICRAAYRVVTGQGASDDRSDEEDGVTDKRKEQ
ncbi:longevity assurance proteins LAG1/LAC1 [Imleria badia]|nr:longevity assurance proteins LAG1/LAC1 [Imleria badia]